MGLHLNKALTTSEAEQAILARVTPMPVETLTLQQCHGRILRQEVLAERDNPPFDRVCMDGIAVDSRSFDAGNRRFRIQATQSAGQPPLRLTAADAAIEVMTGAVLPQGTDCVIPLENYALQAGVASLQADATARAGLNVQRRGSDSGPGMPMLTPGMKLGAAEIAVVASAGLAAVAVSAQPRIVVISTGDELVEPGQPIADHQIRRSNVHGVAAALQLHGYSAVEDAHLPDNEALMQQRLGEYLHSHDVVVLSGGVSKGKFDFVPAALRSLQVTEVITAVDQRPGRPMWFGVGPNGQLVFGLPGNPVATLICLVRYVLPALHASMLGRARRPARVVIADAMPGRGVANFLPVTLRTEDTTPALVSARIPQGSGDFLSLAGTDGFVELPPQPEGYAAGYVADFHRW